MRNNFDGYKAELDRLRFTDDSRKALTASLTRRSQNKSRGPSRRLSGTLRYALAAAAAVCLLATAGFAAVIAAPTLRDYVFSGGAAYEQSSAFIGRTVDNNGWTVTITDCVGDDRNLYLGLDLAAPEGTVLDADWYYFGKGSVDFDLRFIGGSTGKGWSLNQLPDENPADNRLAFIISLDSIYEDSGSLNGQRIRLKLPALHTGVWDSEKERLAYIPVCTGSWDFGVMTISYPDSTIRLEPDVPVTTLGVEAVITKIAVSPLSVRIYIEGDALKGHHSWVPKDAPDGWYSCIDYQEIVLHFDDGTSFAVDSYGSRAGSGCSGGTDTSEDGWLILNRTYSGNVNGHVNQLIDIDRVVSISVCGVDIPLR